MGLGDFTLRVPNRDPSNEEELGRDWPLWRERQSRLEGVLRRMWGLLMMDPCGREERQITDTNGALHTAHKYSCFSSFSVHNRYL